MVIRAGDMKKVTINSREFDPAPDSSCTVRLGGFSNSVAMNGNGTLTGTQKRMTAGFYGLSVSVDDSRQDLEFLKEVADSGVPVSTGITLASGVTYHGSLILVAEELGKATGEGTTEFDMVGERVEQI